MTLFPRVGSSNPGPALTFLGKIGVILRLCHSPPRCMHGNLLGSNNCRNRSKNSINTDVATLSYHSFNRSIIPSFNHLIILSFIPSFPHSSLPLFLPSFLHSFLPSFLPSFIPSCNHSFIHSFIYYPLNSKT